MSIEESNDNSSGSILNTDYFMSNVSHLTKMVEYTGSKLINGGLDTLETVGKKTLEVLQEGDPGLRKKRALFSQMDEKINLSQVCLYLILKGILKAFFFKFIISRFYKKQNKKLKLNHIKITKRVK